ncbi:hypothetical protein DsansV1_C02g0022301 [Dioscorea sansibarensis]
MFKVPITFVLRSGASEMIDLIHFQQDRLHNIMPDELKLWITEMVDQILLPPSKKVIDHDDAVTAGKELVDEVTPNEPSSAGDDDTAAALLESGRDTAGGGEGGGGESGGGLGEDEVGGGRVGDGDGEGRAEEEEGGGEESADEDEEKALLAEEVGGGGAGGAAAGRGLGGLGGVGGHMVVLVKACLLVELLHRAGDLGLRSRGVFIPSTLQRDKESVAACGARDPLPSVWSSGPFEWASINGLSLYVSVGLGRCFCVYTLV